MPIPARMALMNKNSTNQSTDKADGENSELIGMSFDE